MVGINKFKAKSAELEREQNFSRIQKEYLERVGWIRSDPDEKGYKNNVLSFLHWYFVQIDEHQTRFGLSKKFDAYLDELDKRVARFRSEQAQRPSAETAARLNTGAPAPTLDLM